MFEQIPFFVLSFVHFFAWIVFQYVSLYCTLLSLFHNCSSYNEILFFFRSKTPRHLCVRARIESDTVVCFFGEVYQSEIFTKKDKKIWERIRRLSTGSGESPRSFLSKDGSSASANKARHLLLSHTIPTVCLFFWGMIFFFSFLAVTRVFSSIPVRLYSFRFSEINSITSILSISDIWI